MKKFKLELSAEKTHIISFSRFRQKENTTFEFLGFEFRWGKSRKGKDSLKRHVKLVQTLVIPNKSIIIIVATKFSVQFGDQASYPIISGCSYGNDEDSV